MKYGVDTALTVYINNTTASIDFSSTSIDFGQDLAIELFDAFVLSNNIRTDIYSKILTDLGYNFDTYDAHDLSDEKIEALITNGILEMDSNSLEFVRSYYTSHLFSFIRKNYDVYLALQNNETFKIDEAMQILKWDVDDSKKIELLTFTSEPISISNNEYTDAVNVHILNNNFMPDDKLSLYVNYSKYGLQTQKTILKMAETSAGIREIINSGMDIDNSMRSDMLKSDLIDRGNKISLLSMSIPSLNEDSFSDHLDELELSELKKIFTKGGGRRNYAKNTEVATILDALQANGWIYDYFVDERNSDKYEVVKNKPG